MEDIVVALASFWFFFNIAKADPNKTFLYGFCNSQVSVDVRHYKDAVVDLMVGLIDDTPTAKGFDYYNEAADHDGMTTYGHGVCTEMLTADECHSCIDIASNLLWGGCSLYIGGQLQLRDCRVLFENYKFRIKSRSTTKMYVTRPLSHYRRFPSAVSTLPEGPNSGYLVIQDDESVNTCCFGSCEDTRIYELPFPQNKTYTVRFSSGTGSGVNNTSSRDVIFIPVVNQPLSSNLYYAVEPHGRLKGEVQSNLKEAEVVFCCCNEIVPDANLQLFDPGNVHQHFLIYPYESLFNSGSFCTRSVEPEGRPPRFLSKTGWRLYTNKSIYLDDAPGVDLSSRARHPSFDFPLAQKRSEAVVIGKWYCPFLFVKDGSLADQVKKSMFYEMTLQQRWEQVYTCENGHRGETKRDIVIVDAVVEDEVVSVGGNEAEWGNVVDGVMWFRSARGENKVGLSTAIMERMKWEEERAGWVRRDERWAIVRREVEIDGAGEWERLGCYVLVERFVLRRMDGSVVLTCDFKHTHVIKIKQE